MVTTEVIEGKSAGFSQTIARKFSEIFVYGKSMTPAISVLLIILIIFFSAAICTFKAISYKNVSLAERDSGSIKGPY